MTEFEHVTALSRRAFVKNGALLLAASTLDWNPATDLFAGEQSKPKLRAGMLTDLHYADKDVFGTRYYRETLDKLSEAGKRYENENPAFIVELGDLIDAADTVEAELAFLKRIDKEFAAISKNRHYVLGNHCVHALTKDEFLGAIERERAYYSFDAGDYHFAVLDACFRSDGEPYGRLNFEWTDTNIPSAQVEWLRSDLKQTTKKSIIFAHQRLDVSTQHGVKNAAEVRKVLEESGKVLAVFQGHSHQNDHSEIAGIHYCTLRALVEGSGEENNGYSLMDILPGDVIRITGFRKQKNYLWS
jgi:predicted MPP superfamily phosphohydrolase